MNEELTPLGAFERIKNSLDYHKSYTKDILPTKAKIIDEEDKDELQIIENALKEYELMKQTKFIVADKKVSDEVLEKLKNQRMFVGSLEQCEIKPLFDEETTKKLKALERFKELLDSNTICRVFGFKSYEIIDFFKSDDLIREVLKND